MGPWRTRRNNHTVQGMLDYFFGNERLGVGGAGKHVVFRKHDIGKGFGIGRHLGDIHHTCDIDPAGTDKNADSWVLVTQVGFRGIDLFFHPCASGHRQSLGRFCGGCRGLGHRLGNILGAADGSGDVNPFQT